ncbi:MAG TPA: hypothetical protein VMP67_06000 [Candidatus Limnocylindria bacterium]|nr:hypothetical protein [Candidatus Limnocylindria bacterium]
MFRMMGKIASGALLALIVAACGGAAGPPLPGAPGGTDRPRPDVPTQPGQPAGSIDSCALLSDEEIEAATGTGVVERRPSTLTQVFPSVCDIQLDGGELTLGVKSSGGREMYECCFEPFIGEDSYLDEAVSGLGDKAGQAGQSALMVLEDDVLFDVQLIGGPPDKMIALTYLAERILAKLPCLAVGCPAMTLPPVPTAGPATPSPTQPSVDPGALPSTGALARVVNLFSENGQPVEVDVYAYMWSSAEMRETGALVASVPYGQASDWFNPGLVESPFGSEGYTKIDIYRGGERDRPIAGVGEFLGPGTVTTIAVWQEEVFEGQPGAWTQAIYAEHPTYPIPQALPDGALLVSGNGGLRAEGEPPILYASVGDGCLESPIERWDPDIPNSQPVGNDLVLPVGQWTLTVHEEPFDELPTCKTPPLGPGTPISVAAGERWLAFPYRLPGTTDVNVLIVSFDAP